MPPFLAAPFLAGAPLDEAFEEALEAVPFLAAPFEADLEEALEAVLEAPPFLAAPLEEALPFFAAAFFVAFAMF